MIYFSLILGIIFTFEFKVFVKCGDYLFEDDVRVPAQVQVPSLTEVSDSCDTVPRKVVVKGDSIKFSEFLKPDGTLNTTCTNGSSISEIHIFASSKILIDRSLNAPGTDLFVLGPTWELSGYRFINLKGLSGEHMTNPPDGSLGADGMVGKPGNPGKPGGNFFGIGTVFIDGSSLTVSVSGGDGGPGQEGGRGGGGSVGPHAHKEYLKKTINCVHSPCNKEGTSDIIALDNQKNYTEFKCKEEYNYIIYDQFFLPPTIGNKRECSYYVFGSPGVVPGAGGDGGAGGLGGLPGAIFIFGLADDPGISHVNQTGKKGVDGKGADGGPPSYTSWDVSFKKSETYSQTPPYMSGNYTIQYIDSYRQVYQENSVGADGKNLMGLKYPVPPTKLDIFKISEVMEQYVHLVRNKTNQNEPEILSYGFVKNK